MSDDEARKIREDAVEYADRVAAGEEPWREDPTWQEEQQAEKDAQPVDERGNLVEDARDDDVGETGEPVADEA
jgi:hypothetical protein